MGTCRWSFSWTTALLLGTTSLSAQVLELHITSADSTAAPIAGAIVRLMGESGPVSTGLTNEQGRISLRSPVPGSFRIRIDRIGWTGMITEPIALTQGETVRRDIRMTSSHVLLPTVTVRGNSRCGRDLQDGGPSALVWEEVRKALTATVMSRIGPPLHVREFVRELNLKGQSQREWVVLSRIVRNTPFKAIAADQMVRNGFVRNEADSMAFIAPDAETLLSDEFVTTHCFRVVPGQNGMVGLQFDPVRGRRVPEVTGTLWLARATSDLRTLEYSYVQVPGMEQATLGGRLEFRRLTSGRWIVSYWHIRMPRIESYVRVLATRESAPGLAGYFEKGGRAEQATDTLGFLNRAIVRGTVFDSTTGSGLRSAIVAVWGTTDSIVTDADGHFEFAVAASGDREVRARHPKLGMLGEPTSVPALLSIGDTTTVAFGVPSLATFVKRLCRNRAGPAVIGMVSDSLGRGARNREVRIVRRTVRGDIPLGATAVASLPAHQRGGFDDPFAGHSGVSLRGVANGREPVRTDQHGLYSICGVPGGRDTLYIVSADSGRVRGETAFTVGERGRWVDIREWGHSDTTTTPLRIRP